MALPEVRGRGSLVPPFSYTEHFTAAHSLSTISIEIEPALSKCFLAVGGKEGVLDSKHQFPLPARGLLVKSSVQ